MSGRYERKKEPKKVSGKKIGLIIGIVVLVLILAVGIAGVMYYNSVLDKMNYVEVPKITYGTQATEAPEVTEAETTEATTVATTEPHVASSADYINVLLVGNSARKGEDSRLADTMILCTINTYEKTLTLTSMLRDTLVKMPNFNGHYGGKIKLTTVYHLGSYYTDGDENEKIAGSMAIINQCLYDNFGVEVDYNFEINFEIFIELIDMLGGVAVELTEAEAKYLNKDTRYVYRTLEPGWVALEGSEALSYARMRKADGDGESDIKRTARQRHLIEGIIRELRRKSPSELQAIVDAVLPMVTTSMTKSEITDTLLTMLPMVPSLKVTGSGTCPAEYGGRLLDIYDDGNMHSVLTFDVKKTTEHMRAITEGETQPTEATEPAK